MVLHLFFERLDHLIMKIGKVLSSKSLKLLAGATSLIWALVYDCEKAKVTVKRANLKDELIYLERRLLCGIYPLAIIT
jgi:hypothetical protein